MNNYRINSYLLENERVLWEGEAGSKTKFKGNGAGMAFQFVFGLFFSGFALFWMLAAGAASKGDGVFSFFSLFGLPFLLVGLYVSFGPFIRQKKLTKNCLYVVTDRRIISFINDKVTSLYYDNVYNVDLVLGNNDRGWIYIHRNATAFLSESYSSYSTHSVSSTADKYVFVMNDIKNVANVYKIIMNAKEQYVNRNDNNKPQSPFSNPYNNVNVHHGNPL